MEIWLQIQVPQCSCACVHAQSVESCLTLCNPMDCSPPGFSVHWNFQARILEWVTIPFVRGSPPSGIEPTTSAPTGGFFTTEPLGKYPSASTYKRQLLIFPILYFLCLLLAFSIKKEIKLPNLPFSSVAQSCLTLCSPMDCSTLGFPVHHQLPELAQTHVHQVSDAIQPSHPLSTSSPPAFNLSQHQGLFQGVSSSHQVAKVLEFQHQHQSFQ